MNFNSEIERRRTFGIVSHPDAGKTTLTEKLLLFGGAIQEAGAVKNNKIKKGATSDFMEIERQRGISVATSVLAFEYKGTKINILDTPGHKDFAEDTFRTLTAVDSVIVVIDVAKGVEEQTEKLMEVCRMRDIPVLIFVNKLDREGKDAFDLLDELEEKLDIKVRPLAWPIGIGADFKGVYNIHKQELNLFDSNKTEIEKDIVKITDINDQQIDDILGSQGEVLRSDLELIEGVYDDFEPEEYEKAQIAPVFFGSALYNFGVQELLESFIELAPSPLSRPTNQGDIEPEREDFSGFIFKIHANLDPNHRNRLAFLRVCSGTFKRNTFYKHVRAGKNFKFSNPYTFMAQSKLVVEEAFPGDVVGLYDTGNFKIGDTLTDGKEFMFKGIPSFSPELFREVQNQDPMKTKQLEKGLLQLTEEGVAQLFIRQPGNVKILGTVGDLQFEVIQYRLKHEYGASCNFKGLPFHKATWITTDNQEQLNDFLRIKSRNIVQDKDDNWVFLAESPFLLDMARRDYPDLVFHTTSEFKVTAE